MAKKKTKFVCQECGYESAKWMGKCPGCQSWNTMVEEFESTSKQSSRSYVTSATTGGSKPQSIVSVKSDTEARISTTMLELDRVLGGGIVPGSLVLVGETLGLESRPSYYNYQLN